MTDNREVYDLILKAQKGDPVATEKLVENNTGLVWSLVNRFNLSCNAQDLFQIGCIGLMKAILNFDTGYDVKFSTYAVPIILGEIKRYFRDEGAMRISRSLKENYIQIQRCREQLAQTLQCEPTPAQIAKELKMETGDVLLSLQANQFVGSMDEICYQSDGSGIMMHERIEDKNSQDIELKLSLESEIGKLEQREKTLLYLRYTLDYNQQKTAEKLGISQVQVSRLEKKICRKLRERLS